MELPTIEVAVHVRVGEEELRWAAFDNYVEHVRATQLVERLGGQNHGGVCFPPRLERLDDVSLNAWVRSEEHTSELQSQSNLVCRLLLEKKKKYNDMHTNQ